jgi:rod shape determining protein RodA
MTLQRLHLDKTLFYALLVLAGLSMAVIYSASGKSLGATGAHLVRLAIGFLVMFALAQMRPDNLERWTPYLFGAGLALLAAVMAVGVIGKGAQRWLSLGFVRFQPSEIMKLAVPMMVAWYLARASLPPSWTRLAMGFAIILVPAAMIARQPDLGTALMVAAAGFFVLFLAGLHWRVLGTLLVAAAAAVPFAWHYLHDYQRQRILTFLDPESDPLGSGYHILQSKIAFGSGGVFGKGYLMGTQSHLSFLPERQTDFIFTMLAEEFGMLGGLVLLALYGLVILYGYAIAMRSRNQFGRLLALGITSSLFFYVFINTAMVMGLIPVVGVPLPLISYGGTAMLTLLMGFGLVLSVNIHRDARIGQHGFDEA